MAALYCFISSSRPSAVLEDSSLFILRSSLFFSDCFLIAITAERLVFVFLTEEYSLIVRHQSMAHVCNSSTLYADGVHFGYLIGDGAKGGNRTKGNTLVVHIKARNDDTHTTIG